MTVFPAPANYFSTDREDNSLVLTNARAPKSPLSSRKPALEFVMVEEPISRAFLSPLESLFLDVRVAQHRQP